MVDALEQRGEELAAANHAYMELLPFVSHKLKNYTASMMTDARVRSEGYLGTLDTWQAQRLEKLIAKVDYLLGLVRGYADHPDLVACDPNPMKIVVVNLLGNAVKYGREGGRVLLRFQREVGEIKVTIRNEGPGFTAEDHSLFFKKFSRLPSPELRSKKGTGVDLYTCPRIVTLHGGSLDATSELGSWAEFRFNFPQPLPELPVG